MTPKLILVGGFLGAGKTTLLLAAATRLRALGRRASILVNDQGGELIDTRLAEVAGFDTQEITGGCFCCRFSDFVRAAERLAAAPDPPEFIFAEPVGSCTDLSATILQPLKRLYGDRFRLAPLTIVADPARAEELLAPHADPLLAYLFCQQIAEADQVWFTKADLHDRFPDLDGVLTRKLSARSGEGVDDWLAGVIADDAASGSRLLDIDYQRYADAEAALGWMNWRAEVRLRRALTPAAVAGPLIESLHALLTDAGIAIAHLKILARSGDGYVRASICRTGGAVVTEGALDAPPARRHELVLNLRAVGAPEGLNAVVSRAAGELPGKVTVWRQECFRPARPRPEFRFQEIV